MRHLTGGAKSPAWFENSQRTLRVRAVMKELGLTHALDRPSDHVFRCEHFHAELGAVLPAVTRGSRRCSPVATATGARVTISPRPSHARHSRPR